MKPADHDDLLIELGTEELPAAAQQPLAAALGEGLAALLTGRGIAAGEIEIFSTPRRLAVLAHDVAPAEPDRVDERRGPSLAAAFAANGHPTAAAKGFARSVGVAVEALETLRSDQGAWLIHRKPVPGLPLAAVLQEHLPRLLTELPLPRRMRWGAGEVSFLRPVRWLVVRYGKASVPVEAFGLVAEGASRGHRFHHPAEVAFKTSADYAAAMRKARVIADPRARLAELTGQIERLATALGAKADAPVGLLEEIAGMVEWPVTVAASFDGRFLDLPEPVLTTTLAHHQRFVPLRGASGKLTTDFIAVMNLESKDPAQLRAGLERVVRPRLADAEFYYQRDRRQPLGDYAAALEGLAFGEKLGSMADKSKRLERLAAALAEVLGGDPQTAARAGLLAKCDLVTGMVFEFPELQGIMGGHYAVADGETDAVAAAIAEQYLPAGANDPLPTTPAGAALALADRLDSLVGGFSSGRQPTGTKDPFGLRRAAFGLLGIAAEHAPELDLTPWLARAAAEYPSALAAADSLPALEAFLQERLRSLLLEQNQAPDVVQAVLAVVALKPAEALARARAVTAFRQRPEAEALAAANKRIANILRQADDIPTAAAGSDEAPEAAALGAALQTTETQLDTILAGNDFDAALLVLATLRDPVDRFFDKVLVMDPDPGVRGRLLTLLSRLRASFLRVADVGKLQGSGEK